MFRSESVGIGRIPDCKLTGETNATLLFPWAYTATWFCARTFSWSFHDSLVLFIIHIFRQTIKFISVVDDSSGKWNKLAMNNGVSIRKCNWLWQLVSMKTGRGLEFLFSASSSFIDLCTVWVFFIVFHWLYKYIDYYYYRMYSHFILFSVCLCQIDSVFKLLCVFRMYIFGYWTIMSNMVYIYSQPIARIQCVPGNVFV